jgi:protein-L-isoaspartate(D-aspartate) O-methyltransferase
VLSPLSFTPEFRRKMAELSRADRHEWLTSLAARIAVLRASHGPRGDAALSALEAELAEVARGCRIDLVAHVEEQLGPFDPLQLRAVLEVPRERFVRDEDLAQSADDTPLPLDDHGLATISAPHAYLLSYRLLELAPGDSLLELGSGSGYGAALAAHIVGGERKPGFVVTVEIDPHLADWAAARLAGLPNVRVRRGDAMEALAEGLAAEKISVTFAVEEVPASWLSLIPEGGRLVAPVGPREGDQRLVRVLRRNGRLERSEHGAVRYVKNRSPTHR